LTVINQTCARRWRRLVARLSRRCRRAAPGTPVTPAELLTRECFGAVDEAQKLELKRIAGECRSD
jgi:hypothetical protein